MDLINPNPAQHTAVDMATANQFRALLQSREIRTAHWSRERGFSPMAVYRVLNGYEQGRRGKSKQVAEAILATVAEDATAQQAFN